MTQEQTTIKPTVEERIQNLPTLYPMSTELKLRVKERGLDQAAWNTLKSSIFPNAKDESILLAIDYCRSRKLDILKKPVHIVPMSVSTGRKNEKGWDIKEMRDVIMPSIAEIRITAMRTGEYIGNEGEEFGPDMTKRLDGVEYTFPEWCRYTVIRLVAGRECRFVGPKVYWLEAYATASSKTDAPNSMWATRARGQLSKCAEAAALRYAFPEQLGSDYAAEEVEGHKMRDVTPAMPNIANQIGEAIKNAKQAETEPKVVDVVAEDDQNNHIEQDEPEQSPESFDFGATQTEQGEITQ